GKKFYKIRDPVTGWWHSPKDFDKPVPVSPLAKVMTSNGDKAIKTVGIVNDPSELALEFGSTNGHKIPGLFANVRARFKEAITYYMNKGWLSDTDLAEMGLERKVTKIGGLVFPTSLGEHDNKRKQEGATEKFKL
ncbi:unnamed protein product, partial [marine sediment metagenome]